MENKSSNHFSGDMLVFEGVNHFRKFIVAGKSIIYQQHLAVSVQKLYAKVKAPTTWMSQKVSKWLVNGLFHLLINGIHSGYNLYPFTNHLLTFWIIQGFSNPKSNSNWALEKNGLNFQWNTDWLIKILMSWFMKSSPYKCVVFHPLPETTGIC